LRTKPRFTYNGLTVVLSKPSRFDKAELLSATGGWFFTNQCLAPEFNKWGCDIRTLDVREPLLPGTKAVLLLGQEAAQLWLNNYDNTLNEIRGSVYLVNDIPHIASYFPQDCVDIKDYETEFNPIKSGNQESAQSASESGEEDSDPFEDKRRHGKTKRANFGFWLRKDTEKIKKLLSLGGAIPKRPFEPEYVIYPAADIVIDKLENTKNEFLYFDCETDEDLNIQCFAFSFGERFVYVVPVLSYDYSWAYNDLHRILKALAIAIHDNTLVAHNGASFDFFVLAHKLHIPIGQKVYDTLLAQHRCFSEVEKSLGHCTSLWTWEPFHKDEGDSGYYSPDAMRKLMAYCGKDVFTMILVHRAIEEYARRIPGLKDSIDQANAAVRAYLTETLQGIRYVPEMVDKIFEENDELMRQYNRMIELLVGPESMKQLRKKSKNSLASSNMQCCIYFHDMLGYDVIMRSKKTGKPSLGKKAMLKLRIKYENPVITLILTYREIAKESGSLKWTPWMT
jgi:hypothetical protein